MFIKILQAIISLPKIFGLLKDLILSIIEMFKKGADQKFVSDLREEVSQLKKAETSDERIEIAKRLNDLIKRL